MNRFYNRERLRVRAARGHHRDAERRVSGADAREDLGCRVVYVRLDIGEAAVLALERELHRQAQLARINPPSQQPKSSGRSELRLMKSAADHVRSALH